MTEIYTDYFTGSDNNHAEIQNPVRDRSELVFYWY